MPGQARQESQDGDMHWLADRVLPAAKHVVVTWQGFPGL